MGRQHVARGAQNALTGIGDERLALAQSIAPRTHPWSDPPSPAAVSCQLIVHTVYPIDSHDNAPSFPLRRRRRPGPLRRRLDRQSPPHRTARLRHPAGPRRRALHLVALRRPGQRRRRHHHLAPGHLRPGQRLPPPDHGRQGRRDARPALRWAVRAGHWRRPPRRRRRQPCPRPRVRQRRHAPGPPGRIDRALEAPAGR